MALAYRVNVNICPLLNIFYCKCVTNSTRFKSQLYGIEKESKNFPDNDPSKHTLFSDMITYRQNQAHRSILVKVTSFSSTNRVHKFCSRFGQILNVFSYNTQNGQRFILIEFSHNHNVLELRKNASKYMGDPEAVRSVSPLFVYSYNKYSEEHVAFLEPKVVYHSKFEVPIQSKIINALKPLKTVPEQMISLYNMLKVTELDVRLRFYTAEELTYYLSRLFVNLFVVPFGSSVNGFGQTGCDLDLLCKSYDPCKPEDKHKHFHYLSQLWNFNERDKQKQLLETIYILMKTCIPGITNMKRIFEARVPIIKFTNLNTNMQCDLSSTNMIALYMSEMLYTYGELDYRVRPLVCTIRKWARVHNITKENPGHWITNFSLTLLVIFYLQRRNILPPLVDLKSSIVEASKKSATKNDESLDKLLYGFFDYYSNFNFKVQAICIRDGKVKEKKDNSPVYIYNPFESALNVSKNINNLELVRILHSFQSALHTLVSSYEGNVILNLLNCKSSLQSKVKSENHSTNDNIILEKQSELLNEEILNADESEQAKEIIK